MLGHYEMFFAASAGASAAILGLLVVGLLATNRLIARANRAGNFSRGFPTRRLNISFAIISAGGYSIQLGLAIALLADTQSSALQRALVLVIVGLFGSALGRAWEVTGIPRRRLPESTDR